MSQGRLLASLSLNLPGGLAQTVLGGHVAHRGGKLVATLSPALLADCASSGQFLNLSGPPLESCQWDVYIMPYHVLGSRKQVFGGEGIF